jgi:DNA primase
VHTSTPSLTPADPRDNFDQARMLEGGISNDREHRLTSCEAMAAENPTLPPIDLRRLLKSTDIAELVSGYCRLNPTDTDSVLRGHCPIAPDEQPLFFVMRSSQTFYCLGCGAAGDAVNFLARLHHVDETAAAMHLQRLQETCRRDDIAHGGDPVVARTLIEVNTDAARFFSEQLKANPAALHYLNERGVTQESISQWGLGYAPEGWDATLAALKQYPAETIVTAGLAVARDGGGQYDRFRARLMFPIRHLDAAIIGFGGRVLGEDAPKYLNSPDSPLFHKGSQLYGQYESSQVNESIDRLWVVEGYMDVVTLWQHGIRNCVATLGTSTTPQHVLRLGNLTDNTLYCFDGDPAGRRAAWRALQSSLPVLRPGRRFQFLILPEGEDPDSLVRKRGAEALNVIADRAVPLAEFLCRHLANAFDIDTVDGRARLLAKAITLLAQVRDPASRYEIAVAVSERARVTPEVVQGLARTDASNMHMARRPITGMGASVPVRRPAV